MALLRDSPPCLGSILLNDSLHAIDCCSPSRRRQVNDGQFIYGMEHVKRRCATSSKWRMLAGSTIFRLSLRSWSGELIQIMNNFNCNVMDWHWTLNGDGLGTLRLLAAHTLYWVLHATVPWAMYEKPKKRNWKFHFTSANCVAHSD